MQNRALLPSMCEPGTNSVPVRARREFRAVASRLASALSRRPTWRSLIPLLVYAPLAGFIASVTGVIEWQPAGLAGGWPLLLLLFPVLPEELFFRGVLIRTTESGRLPHRAIWFSSVAFVIWHPLNALTINSGARDFFLDPALLGVVGLL